jgi:hypothetical protein
MKRFEPNRAAAAIAALGAAPTALADAGGMTPAGWVSLFAVPVVVAILYIVHKKLT